MRNLLCALLLFLLCVSPAMADEIEFDDPATLHIGPGAGTACAQGCGGHPNVLLSGSSLNIFQNQGGATTLDLPILLILGIANNTTNLFATNPISSVVSYDPYSGYPGNATTGSSAFATNGTYGLSGGTNGFFGTFNASSGSNEVYAFLTLQGQTNSSNNFGNWADAYLALTGNTATDFGIYVFAITGSLSDKGLLDIMFSQPLPEGTIAIGYGQTHVTKTTSKGTKTTVTVYTTPFTEAGFAPDTPETPVPEPATMALFGTGLLGLAGAVRRKMMS